MATASKTTERSDATSVPDAQTITDAYLYLLARALVIRQEHHDLAEAGVDYNLIKYNPLGSADFVNPNFDVAYLEAWIALTIARRRCSKCRRSPAAITRRRSWTSGQRSSSTSTTARSRRGLPEHSCS